jgi:hypothetical protein
MNVKPILALSALAVTASGVRITNGRCTLRSR